jgi:hypothetical protein
LYRYGGVVTAKDLDHLAWLETLCRIPREWKTGQESIRELFERAAPDLSEPDHFAAVVRQKLLSDPELVEAWQAYSWDKRSSPSPYMDGTEVGFFDGERRQVIKHQDRTEACADFIYRESVWVLQRKRTNELGDSRLPS